MNKPKLLVSIVRMHHISNPSKFRRLKRHAIQSNVSGLVKTGKPGVLVFDGSPQSIKMFLTHARGLRYLDFHHVATGPMPPNIASRVVSGTPGLHEVEGMNDIVQAMDVLQLKDWFRENLGLGGQG
ncbi:hypothetical protein FA15DRAFT_653809 [Coprinopsis marcescibilis]|uniref:Uncharacterized protein n=1 Tax=Coprinopsis marcescibilis TaxID=230819 RepID=A0A5C3LF80_COPMA|nr:hypothetical protein FA15DRAFT_653809 [Coprinopsis marcescibilis]